MQPWQVPGQPPSLLNPPSGCRFNPRCSYTMARCRVDVPDLVADPTTPNHRDACFLDPSGPVLLWTDYGTNVRAWMHGTEDSSIQSMYARWVDGTFDPRR